MDQRPGRLRRQLAGAGHRRSQGDPGHAADRTPRPRSGSDRGGHGDRREAGRTAAPAAGPSTAAPSAGPPPRRPGGIYSRQGRAGWLFVAPMIVILGLFLRRCRSCMALWVSCHRLDRAGQPVHRRTCRSSALDNYAQLFTEARPGPPGLHDELRNNFYYVLLVVPLQTVLALVLALMVNQRCSRARDVLPHGVLLPVGDQLGRDQRGLPVPVHRRRRGQRGARASSASTGRRGSPTPRGLLHIARRRARLWTPTRHPPRSTGSGRRSA